jgi:endonuclease IV
MDFDDTGGNEEVRRKSIEALKDELNRCNLLNIPYLVLLFLS